MVEQHPSVTYWPASTGSSLNKSPYWLELDLSLTMTHSTVVTSGIVFHFGKDVVKTGEG